MPRSTRRKPAFDPDRLADFDDLLPLPPPMDQAPPDEGDPLWGGIASGRPPGAEVDAALTMADTAAPHPSTSPHKGAVTRGPRRPSSESKAVKAARTNQARGTEASGGPISVAVYIPDDLKALLEQQAAARGRDATYGRIAIDALVRHIDNIDARLSQERETSSPALSKTSRFSPPPQRQQRLRGPGGRQVQFRVSAAEGAWLEELVLTVGAYSRSALIAEALDLELAPKTSKIGAPRRGRRTDAGIMGQ